MTEVVFLQLSSADKYYSVQHFQIKGDKDSMNEVVFLQLSYADKYCLVQHSQSKRLLRYSLHK